MKPRRCSILHDQGMEDDLGLILKRIWSRSSDSQTSKDKGRPPLSPSLRNKNAPGKQTFMQQSWVKPPQSFPVLLLSSNKWLFYVSIKQSWRQQHKQTSVTLILHVSRVVSKEELPWLPECLHLKTVTLLLLSSHISANGTNSCSPPDSGTLTLQLPDNCTMFS